MLMLSIRNLEVVERTTSGPLRHPALPVLTSVLYQLYNLKSEVPRNHSRRTRRVELHHIQGLLEYRCTPKHGASGLLIHSLREPLHSQVSATRLA